MSRGHTDYDAVIVGAGIGGLTCGCYLAQAGMNVLILERHSRPGGYCASFKRKNFLFDAAAHSFGGYRDGGLARQVINELNIDILIARHDPTDVILTPHSRISFHAERTSTVSEFQAAFPGEARNITNFFSFIENPPAAALALARRRTFQDLLDGYFRDGRLKAVLSYPLLGNCGLPPTSLSAFIGAKIFREFLIDGGYYPVGGMQLLSDAFATRFSEYGGELKCSCEVKRILLDHGTCAGVELSDGTTIPSNIVVSNADARQTFSVLVGQKHLPGAFLRKLSNMVPSLSMIVVYMGIDPTAGQLPDRGVNLWYLPHYDLDSLYRKARANHADTVFMLRVGPNKNSMVAFAQASFLSLDYWRKSKKKLLDHYISRIESCIIPGLSKQLLYREAATPATLYRYTLNSQGASYGWDATVEQLADRDFYRPPFVRGLYLVGHWTTQGLGITGAIYTARERARWLLQGAKRKRL